MGDGELRQGNEARRPAFDGIAVENRPPADSPAEEESAGHAPADAPAEEESAEVAPAKEAAADEGE